MHKTCPFCGKAAAIAEGESWEIFARCTNCGATTAAAATVADAWRRWDRRAVDAPTCITCDHFRDTGKFYYCDLVHQMRDGFEWCSRWKECR